MHSSRAARGLAPTRTVLPNGVVVTAKETTKTPAVTINLALPAGSIGDPANLYGATYLLSQLLDRGTAQRSAARIAEDLDDRGVSLSLSVSRHQLSMVCTCLAEDVEFILTLMGEIVREPSIADGELATRRGEVITTIRQDEDNPAVRAVERLMTELYGVDHPYGRPVKGTVSSIERATAEDLRQLHHRRFAANGLSAVVVGDVEVSRVVDIAATVFGDWSTPPEPAVPLAHPSAATTRQRTVIPMMNKSQADVAYGFVTITRSAPEYFPFWLLNNVLGQYAMGGRLGDSIRERQGMAYYAMSTFDPNIIEGPVVIRAGVAASNVDRAIASIDAEIGSVVREGITAKELTESRQYMIGSMPRALETNVGIAQFLQTAEFFGLGLDYDLKLPELLGAVTREQAHEVAARYLDPARATIVVAGPYEERD